MKGIKGKLKDQSGLTFIEVVISALLLSIISISMLTAFTYASKVTRDNRIGLVEMNLANEAVEQIRGMQFAQVGTVIKHPDGSKIYGDPPGEIEQTRSVLKDGIRYIVETTINWEEMASWTAGGDVDWDYKSVKVTVYPEGMSANNELVKEIETKVSRDNTQPPLTGSNLRVGIIRGWQASTNTPVSNVQVKLENGPSAPRIFLTSSNGAGRFIGLQPGDYHITVDPSGIGMMLNPSQELGWNMSLADMQTLSHKFEVEYPCAIRLTLKDITGDPITISSGDAGKIDIQVPYGTNIEKDFMGADMDPEGRLPQDFINHLWPVGNTLSGNPGYAGAYKITSIDLPNYLYTGSYAVSGSGEVLWDGTFQGPGTNKTLINYFVWVPVSSDEVTKLGVSGGNILPGKFKDYNEENDSLLSSQVRSETLTDSLIMPSIATEFTGYILYFNNTGSGTIPGLIVRNKANLMLRAGSIVFRGAIKFDDNSNPTNLGVISLQTTQEDGNPLSFIKLSKDGHEDGKTYGKLYLQEPMYLGDNLLLEKGAYYFFNGLSLPSQASELIPITKENYAN